MALKSVERRVDELELNKQDILVSGVTIKTINGNSVLGSGNLVISTASTITVGTTPVTSGTDGRVFFQSGGVVQQDSSLFWDNTNKRLGVGTNAPDRTFDVNGIARIRGALTVSVSNLPVINLFDTLQNHTWQFRSNGKTLWFIADGQNRVVYTDTGSVGVGTISPQARLDVRAQGALSTDIAFRVRNSADTANLISVAGNGNTILANDILVSPSGGTRYIQSPNGSIGFLSSNSTGYTLWTEHNRVCVQGGLSISSPSFTAQGANTIHLRTTSTQTSPTGVSSELSFSPIVNHVSTLVTIRGGDSSFGGQTTAPTPLYIFGGRNTTTGNYGDIYLQHDYTTSRGSVGIGTNSINASAKLQVDSITQGFLPPRMTTTQRTAIATPAAGLMVYDTTDNKHYGFDGTTWNALY